MLTGREVRLFMDRLGIAATDQGVRLIRAWRFAPPASARARRLVEQARKELRQYFDGRRTIFTVPVNLTGLPKFQRKVLATVLTIPFGEVRSYTWVAQRIGHPRAARAVGTALGRNPVPIIVPCHRVRRSDGGMGGYLFGLSFKERLLALERESPGLTRRARR